MRLCGCAGNRSTRPAVKRTDRARWAWRLDQAHKRRYALAGTKASCEQPVAPIYGDRQDLVLDPIVVLGNAPVVEVVRRRAR